MFERIKAFVSGLSAAVHAFLNSKGGQIVKSALAGLIAELGPVVSDLLLSLADAAVAQAEQKSGLAGLEKKNAAAAAVTTALKASGHDVLQRQINLAIEMAVEKLNAPPSA